MKSPDNRQIKIPFGKMEKIPRSEKDLERSIAAKKQRREIYDVEESAYLIRKQREEIEDRGRERHEQHGP